MDIGLIMEKHLRNLKITIIFLICFFVFIPSAALAVDYIGSFIGENGSCIQFGVNLNSAEDMTAITTSYIVRYPGGDTENKYLQGQLLPTQEWTTHKRPSGATYTPVMSGRIYIKGTSSPQGLISLIVVNPSSSFDQTFFETNNCTVAPPLCDQTTIDAADAACPLGTGYSYCDADTLITMCDTCMDQSETWGTTNCPFGLMTSPANGDFCDEIQRDCKYKDCASIATDIDSIKFTYPCSTDLPYFCDDSSGTPDMSTFKSACRDCANTKRELGIQDCGVESLVENFSCLDLTLTCRDSDPGRTCVDFYQECYSSCGGKPELWDCLNNPDGTVTISQGCTCKTTGTDLGTNNSPDPGTPQDSDTTTPTTTTTDPNAKITADNTKVIAEILNKNLPDIKTAIDASSALNTKNIKSLSTGLQNIASSNTSITTGLQNLSVSNTSGTSDITSKLSEISNKLDGTGTYSKETITNDYVYGENTSSQFTTRFDSFVTDLKSTPLFSLPNQVLLSIPNSTTSSYSLGMGSYGQFDFDFANYATPLLILRSCFLICFSYAGLRIVVSKK